MSKNQEEGLQVLCEHAYHASVPLVVRVENQGEMVVMSPRVLESLLFDRVSSESFGRIQQACFLL